MLNYFFLKQRWVNYIKNNLYFDYGLKFFIKACVYNLLIQTAYFFAEKYIIEYNTRFIFNYFSYAFYRIAFDLNNNKLLVITSLSAINLAIVLV